MTAGISGKIGQADKFGHETDAGTAGGGHGACPGPSGAHDHADGRQFVFRLDDGVGGLARFGVGAQFGRIVIDGFGNARTMA